MSTWLTHLDATKSGVLVLSAVLRRQGFLVRALGGNSENCFVKMNALEADALNIITRITPKLDSSRHKGQAGEFFSSFVFNFVCHSAFGFYLCSSFVNSFSF